MFKELNISLKTSTNGQFYKSFMIVIYDSRFVTALTRILPIVGL